MLKLEDVKKDCQIRGIQSNEIVRVVQVEPVGEDAVTVYYKDRQGRVADRDNSDHEFTAVNRAGRHPGVFHTFRTGSQFYQQSCSIGPESQRAGVRVSAPLASPRPRSVEV